MKTIFFALSLLLATTANAAIPIIYGTPSTENLGSGMRFVKSDTTTTCAPAVAGSMRNNAGTIQFCNGSAWYTPAAASGGSGTVTSVVAGTGLTGGTISTSGTLAVDVGTAANKIVQLTAAAKLPAVDGSLLTNLPSGSGANATLSNLTDPTAVNQNLSSENDNGWNLGTPTKRWSHIFGVQMLDASNVVQIDLANRTLKNSSGVSVLNWASLTAGTNGYVLSTNGSGAVSWIAAGGSGANTQLSNLSGTTAVPVNLSPGTDVSYDLGTPSFRWNNLWVNAIQASSQVQAGDAVLSSNLLEANVGQLQVQTADNPSGNSGDLIIKAGTASATRGTIKLVDGSESGGAGYVWTLQDNVGTGMWAAAGGGGGGANTTLSNLAGTTALNSHLIFTNTGGVHTAAASGGASGEMQITTGNGVSPGDNTGDISVITGTEGAGGTRGNIYLKNGTEVSGSSGWLWTLQSNDGLGKWQPFGAGISATANTVFVGPVTGSPAAPTFRALSMEDIPPIDIGLAQSDSNGGIVAASYLDVANGGTGVAGGWATDGIFYFEGGLFTQDAGNFDHVSTMAGGTIKLTALGGGAASPVLADTDGVLYVSSDERLKNISGPYTKSLDELRGINPIKFHWKPESGLNANDDNTGFSAQNVRQFIPEAVGQNKNGYLSLNDRAIVATMVNSIKELEKRVIELEAKDCK